MRVSTKENHGYFLKISKRDYHQKLTEDQKRNLDFARNESATGFIFGYVPENPTKDSTWQVARYNYLRTLYYLVYQAYGGQTSKKAMVKPRHHGSKVDVPTTFYKAVGKWRYQPPIIDYREPSEEEKLANKRKQDLTRVNYTPVKANLPQSKKQYRSIAGVYAQEIGL